MKIIVNSREPYTVTLYQLFESKCKIIVDKGKPCKVTASHTFKCNIIVDKRKPYTILQVNYWNLNVKQLFLTNSLAQLQ